MLARTLAIAALAVPTLLHAQTQVATAPIAAGTHVRISTPTFTLNGRSVADAAGWQTGRLLPSYSGFVTLRLDRDGTELTYPLATVREMQVSGGTLAAGQQWQHDARHGAVAGLALGTFVMGLSAGLKLATDDGKRPCDACSGYLGLTKGILRPTLPHFAIVAGGLGAIGAGVGGMIGRTRTREQWVPVPLGGVSLAVGPRGAMFSLRP